MSTPDAKEHWEQHYGERDRVWSGRVERPPRRGGPGLPIGRALDLGCGEGADSVWLAERGWHVVAVDISDTALRRARSAARERAACWTGSTSSSTTCRETLPGRRIRPGECPASCIPLCRWTAPAIFLAGRRGHLKPGGTLLIVDHSGPPPGDSKLDHHHHDVPESEEVVAALSLPDAEWEPSTDESGRARGRPGPTGNHSLG